MEATQILAENSVNPAVGLLDVKKDVGGSVNANGVDKQTVFSSEKYGVWNLRDGGCDLTSVMDGGIVPDGSLNGLMTMNEKNNKGGFSLTDNVGVNGEGMGIGRWNGEILDHGFRVGDIVWGKITSHPWWPGQVHDPRDASDLALKHSQEGRLLVAFFGDGSCAWCLPSQLVPFVQNLAMSTHCSSKSFGKAVQRAVDEIGRVVESKITCKCLEKRGHLARPTVVNVGIRAGVLMPEVDVGRLPLPEYEPDEMLAKVKDLARSVSVGSVIDLAILRSWISAYYFAKYSCQLAVYREPVVIEGLEDKSNENSCVEDKAMADDWISSPAVSSVNWEQTSDDEVYLRRKQRNVSELYIVEAKLASESIPRERKKSKYLSPPYTNLVPEIGCSRFDESMELDDKKMSFDVSDVDVDVHDLLRKLEFAAVDCFYLRKEGYLDSIWGFISAHRSSTYVCGSDNKIHHKYKRVNGKRKSFSSQSTLKPCREEAGPMDDLISDAREMRRKLDVMTSILENHCPRFSSDDKSCLKQELKYVIENVEMLNEKIRLLAENTSS